MKTNEKYLQIEEFITNLELSAEKINVLIKDIETEYFGITQESIKKSTFNRTRIKVDIISNCLDNFLSDLEKLSDICKYIYR